MKTKLLSASLVLTAGLLSASANELDRRFEGIWTGVETLQVRADFAQAAEPPVQKPTVIAIGDSGRTLAVVQGLYPGRYAVSPKWLPPTRMGVSAGNTLVFAMIDRPTTIFSRDACKLVLSADGNTLTETGMAGVPAQTGALGSREKPAPRICNITGTFHRQGKK